MKKSILLMSAALLFAGSACTHRLTDFTVISTKNVPLGTHAATFKKGDNRVKAKDTSHTILFIPLGTPNMKEAIDRAIESYPNAIGLVDGVVKSSGWTCLFYGQSSYIVEGTPIFEDEKVQEVVINNQNTADSQSNTSLHHVENSVTQPVQQDQESFAVLFYHDVKRSDTLNSIAEAYNVSISDIIKWNQLNNSTLTPGTKLRIMLKD